MRLQHTLHIALLLASAAVIATSCRDHDYIADELYAKTYDNDDEEYDPSQVDLDNFPDWTEMTHSNAAEPNFDTVFEEGKVHKLYITIGSSTWSTMWSDLSSNISKVNNSSYDYTPTFQPCTVNYDGKDWYKVGIRFKGNSSLQTAYNSGVKKLSFKLDFDQYEDSYPALKNQRFYGFKQLNLGNNFKDLSLMREKVGADLFRSFGLASAHTAFYALYIDIGSSAGYQYFGLYTLVEEVDDTVIDDQFSDGSGNLYKPDGDAAQFNLGSYDTSEFDLKTNLTTASYSDVKELYDAINDSSRTSNSASWQTRVETIFDVDTFLKWLAANAVIQNWDTYGRMSHNYFLYNNPSTSKLTWIPWDNNEAFQSTSSNSSGNMGGGSSSMSAIEISSMSSVGTSWPLIKYLYAVDEYKSQYEAYLREFVDEVFITTDMQELYDDYYDLLYDYATTEETSYTFYSSSSKASQFLSAVSTLKSHVSSRTSTVDSYVGE